MTQQIPEPSIRKQPELWDVCAARHGGIATSVEANRQVDKLNDRAEVFRIVHRYGSHGVTLDEVSALMGRMPNAISGRFGELAMQGLIYRTTGRRATRSGASAFVWRVAK